MGAAVRPVIQHLKICICVRSVYTIYGPCQKPVYCALGNCVAERLLGQQKGRRYFDCCTIIVFSGKSRDAEATVEERSS